MLLSHDVKCHFVLLRIESSDRKFPHSVRFVQPPGWFDFNQSLVPSSFDKKVGNDVAGSQTNLTATQPLWFVKESDHIVGSRIPFVPDLAWLLLQQFHGWACGQNQCGLSFKLSLAANATSFADRWNQQEGARCSSSQAKG